MSEGMTITEKNITGDSDVIKAFAGIAGTIEASRVLAVNPRDGKTLGDCIAASAVIDSFVSDDGWVDAAKSFSNEVYAGYSHHPLLQIPDASYDMVTVCEDMAFADDCDAMLTEYFRLLKHGGVLLGMVWNMSHADCIDRLLFGKGAGNDSELCGSSLVPLDCLTERLGEIGFASAVVYRLPGKRKDVSVYADVSSRNISPVPEEVFGTEVYIVCARREKQLIIDS